MVSIALPKRAQAALEFLMTYGWAFFVILILIAGLSHFGLLNSNTYLPESCIGADGFVCVDYKVHSNPGSDAVRIILNNPLESYTLQSARFVDLEGYYELYPGIVVPGSVPPTTEPGVESRYKGEGEVIAPNSPYNLFEPFVVQSHENLNIDVGTNVVPLLESGDVFEGDLELVYVVLGKRFPVSTIIPVSALVPASTPAPPVGSGE